MFRSASGPGLSINTSSANALSSKPGTGPSLFGASSSTSQAQQASSLFGASTATSQPQQSSSLFGGSTAVSQPQQGSSFLGNPATTSQPQQTASLFGAAQSQTNNQQQAGGLFGGAPNQMSNTQQPQGGSLFGNQPTQGTSGGLFPSQQPHQATSNSFTSNAAQPAQAQQTGGFFGSSLGQNQNSTQAQQPQGTKLFGGGINNQNKISLFGNTQNAGQSQAAPAHQTQPVSIFSSTIGQHAQQQQTVPGVRISVNELRRTTRFNDLHEELQKAIEFVDSFILSKINLQEQCESVSGKIDEKCKSLPPDVEYCTKALGVAQRALESDASAISYAKDLVKADAADAKLSFKVIQNLKLPQQFHQTNLWGTVVAPQHNDPIFSDETTEPGGSRNLVEYFSKQADDMAKSLEAYKRNIADVEAYLRGIESNTVQQMQQQTFTSGRHGREKSAEDQVRELAAVLKEFENGILGVANKVGQVAVSVSDL